MRRLRIFQQVGRGLAIGFAALTAAAMMLACASAAGAGEAATQAAAPPAADSAFPQLATISGIVAATLVVVQVIKRLGGNVPWVGKVPVWIYAVAVGCGLTALANRVLGTLSGNLLEMLWQAALASASASGFFSWLNNPSDTPADQVKVSSTPAGHWVSFLAAGTLAIGAMGVSGCSTGLSKGQQYKLASTTYTGTLNSITALSKAGAIPLADLERVDVVRDKANALLDKMRAAVTNGTTLDWSWYSTQLNALLEELIQLELQAEQRRKTTEKANAAGKAVSYGTDCDRGTGGDAGRPGPGDDDRQRGRRGDQCGTRADGGRAGGDRRGEDERQRQLCGRAGPAPGSFDRNTGNGGNGPDGDGGTGWRAADGQPVTFMVHQGPNETSVGYDVDAELARLE